MTPGFAVAALIFRLLAQAPAPPSPPLAASGTISVLLNGSPIATGSVLNLVSGPTVSASAKADPTINGTDIEFLANAVAVLVATSGPVADPGGISYVLENNSTGAITFNLPAGTPGLQRCYRNFTGRKGSMTISAPAGNTIDFQGVNGTTGQLISTGALGEYVCLVSDAANHWEVWGVEGSWLNK